MNDIIILISLFSLLLIIIYALYKNNKKLGKQLEEVISRKQSLSTKYGKMTEQFIPLLELYPYNEQNFRFIGSPVDGVQFNDNSIVLVEFKTADSKLTMGQKNIKELVDKGKVKFQEIRIPSTK